MSHRYNKYHPENNDESSEEMSGLNDMDAILYADGENVFVWKIIMVKAKKLEVPVGKHKICAEGLQIRTIQEYHYIIQQKMAR